MVYKLDSIPEKQIRCLIIFCAFTRRKTPFNNYHSVYLPSFMKKLAPLATLIVVISAALSACSNETPNDAMPETTPITKQQQEVGVNIRVKPQEKKSSQEVGVSIEVNGANQ